MTSKNIIIQDELTLITVDGLGTHKVVLTVDDEGLTIAGPNDFAPALTPGDNPPNFKVMGTMQVSGDIVVAGNYTVVTTGALSVEDKNIFMNVPVPDTDPPANADGAGIVVVRSTKTGLGPPHAGIIWDDTQTAWNLNSEILVDFSLVDPVTTGVLPTNPRILNVGAPTGPNDAATKSYVDGLAGAASLDGLGDVQIALPLDGQILKYTSGAPGNWGNATLSFEDLEGIDVPIVDGYLFVDATTTPGTRAYQFVATIPADDITGLANVAKTGSFLDLVNVPPIADPTEIRNQPVNPTAIVSTTAQPNSVVVFAENKVLLQPGDTGCKMSLEQEVIRIRTPNLGAAGLLGAPITNEVGITLDPGDNRFVRFAGGGIGTISHDNTISIVSGWNVEIEALNSIKLNAFIFPQDGTGLPGQTLIIDPTDLTGKQLIFSDVTIDSLSDVTVSGNVAGQVLLNNGEGWINSQLSYADLLDAPLNDGILRVNRYATLFAVQSEILNPTTDMIVMVTGQGLATFNGAIWVKASDDVTPIS